MASKSLVVEGIESEITCDPRSDRSIFTVPPIERISFSITKVVPSPGAVFILGILPSCIIPILITAFSISF